MMPNKSLPYSQRLALLVSAYLSYGYIITVGDVRGSVVSTSLNENAVMTVMLLITLLMVKPARQLMQKCSLRDYMSGSILLSTLSFLLITHTNRWLCLLGAETLAISAAFSITALLMILGNYFPHQKRMLPIAVIASFGGLAAGAKRWVVPLVLTSYGMEYTRTLFTILGAIITCSAYLSAPRDNKLFFRKPEELFSTPVDYRVFQMILILSTPIWATELLTYAFIYFTSS